ncbi:PepSY domain-containing protein [Hoeflea sp. CAU 1731]
MTFARTIASAAVLAAVTTPAFATGLMTCDSGDKTSWQSSDQLKEKMTADGWQVTRIKEDGGCYEAYGTTPEGQRVEAYYDPLTLELLLIARRGQVLFKKED